MRKSVTNAPVAAFIVTVLLCTGTLQADAAQPLINEVMSSNSITFEDEYGDYPDWIELYNPGPGTIDLAGYTLTDDPEDHDKWTFPAKTIDAGSFLVVFASDRDQTTGINLHTNFKISADGETIMLFDSGGVLCDSVTVGELVTDTSYGRDTDGGSGWLVFTEPSPGTANSDGYHGYTGSVSISQPGGFHAAGITVALTAGTGESIRYTIDGSIPTESSSLYSVPLSIDETTVLRAQAYRDDYLPGPVTTETFFIGTTQNLPVISLSTDPAYFFNYNTGIYVFGPGADSTVAPYNGANFWNDWEVPVHVALYEQGDSGFSMDAGVKIGGGGTRRFPRKSLNIYARDEYGAGSVEYQLFPDLSDDTYDSFQLSNSGNDWGSVLFRDALMAGLISDMNTDTKEFRAVAVYINSQYWGIHFLCERMNEDYLTRHYGIDNDYLDILSIDGIYEVVNSGDDSHYRALESYLISHDISNPENYAYVGTQMDIDNFIDYMIPIIVSANYEWYDSDVEWWRPKSGEGRWRWLSFDFDRAFALDNADDYYHNTLQTALDFKSPYAISSPKLLSVLTGNDEFKAAFVNRTADALNSFLSTERMLAAIDSIEALLDPEMNAHIDRWNDPYSEDGEPDYIPSRAGWLANIEVMRTFAAERPDIVRGHFRTAFGLSGSNAAVTLDVSPEGAGKIKISTIIPGEYPWTGSYFKNIPVTVTAIPASGYKFNGWSGIFADGPSAEIIFTDATAITAIFTEDGNSGTAVISEINYHSSGDTDPGEWVEIMNPTTATIDVSGWNFRDSNDDNDFIIPAGTTIPPNGCIVLSSDITLFHELFPTINAVYGNFDFNLSNGGELIRLYDNSGTLVDSLTYDDEAPWPTEPDGSGATLALTDPSLDNALPASWTSALAYGTPGEPNSGDNTVEEPVTGVPAAFVLGLNYPNPFNPSTVIPFTLATDAHVTLTVYSITGQAVATLVDGYLSAGTHSVVFDAGELPAGLYLTRLEAAGRTGTGKMLLVK